MGSVSDHSPPPDGGASLDGSQSIEASASVMVAVPRPAPLVATLPAAHHATPRQRLRRLLSIEHGDVWVVVGYSAAIGLLALVTPVAIQVLVNQIAFAVLLQPVVIMTLFVLIGWGLSGLLRVLQTMVVELLQERIFVRSAADLAVRLPKVKVAAFEHHQGSEIVNRLLDAVTLQKASAGLLLDAMGIVLQSATGLFILAFYHPLLLAFDVALIICILLILIGLGRGGVTTSVDESRAKYAVVDWLWNVARHLPIFKGSAGAELVHQRTNELLTTYVAARRRHFRVLLRQIGGALALQALGSAALLGLGGALVIAGQLTIGQLVAAEIIVTSVVTGIAKLGKHLESYYDLVASLDKLGYLEDLPEERADGEAALPGPQLGATVRLHEVIAGYDPQPAILHGVQLVLSPGERVAVVGPRRSGKSLLCDLLAGLRAPTSGLIELDGQDLRSLSLESVRSQVAVLRDAELFGGSLADNLCVHRPDASLAEQRAALQAVGLWEELSALPEGLHTRLSLEARTLSSGQRRRLAIARILLLRPRLLLIDDCMALDPSEIEPLCRADAPWTVLLFVRPDNPLAAQCSRRYLCTDGILIEEGAVPPGVPDAAAQADGRARGEVLP
jgi:putative ABC transport system ATP-binding protein